MGETVRQNIIRQKAGVLTVLGVAASLAAKGALWLFSPLDPGTETFAAAGAGAVVAGLLALRLRLRFPNFRAGPGAVQAIERGRSDRIYRLRLNTGRTVHVLLTGGPGKSGTANHLLRLLPGAGLSGATAGHGIKVPGSTARGGWQPVTRAEALARLRAISQSDHRDEPPTSPEPPPQPPVAAESLREADSPAYPQHPPREVIEQWAKDDEYAEEALDRCGVRTGTFGVLRLLTWAVMLWSLYYLGRSGDSSDVGVAARFWAGAFAIGITRGVLLDRRARKSRRVAHECMAEHPDLAARGMPRPWVLAARSTPCGVARILRAALVLLFVFFLIGLTGLIEDSDRGGALIIAGIEAGILLGWVLLTRVISRRTASNEEEANGLAGPRLHWIDHPEDLLDDPRGEGHPAGAHGVESLPRSDRTGVA